MSGQDGVISVRAAAARAWVNFSRRKVAMCWQNEYDPGTNPRGIINLGLAENSLCGDLWLAKYRQPEMTKFEPYMQYYFSYGGQKNFRDALACFLTERFKAKEPLSPDNIAVSSGCGAAMDYLSFTLADEGEYFMFFTPAYYAIPLDFWYRGRVNMVQIPLPTQDREDAKAYEQNVKDLAAAYKQAISERKSVKGVIIVNPHNPTGNIVRREKIVEIVQFCAEHNLHFISNEMYGLSVFDDTATFHSALTLDALIDPNRFHVLWGFSKDFAISGMRCGVIYSRNNLITRDRGTLEQSFYLGSVTAYVQEQNTRILMDKEWLDGTYFPTNLRRMKETYNLVSKACQDMEVPIYKSKAGFFAWINLRKYLPSDSEEGELALFNKLFDAGVYILPGMKLYCKEPGWFRLTFTRHKEVIEPGLQRIAAVLKTLK